MLQVRVYYRNVPVNIVGCGAHPLFDLNGPLIFLQINVCFQATPTNMSLCSAFAV